MGYQYAAGVDDAYREHLIAAGLSRRTIEIYELRLSQVLEWCEGRGVDLQAATASAMREMAEALPASTSFRRQIRSALKHYWEMVERDRPPLGAIRVPKKPNYRNRALPPRQARDLAKVSMGWYPQGVAVQFGLYMALRVSEIAKAEWVRFDEGMEWYRVTGKGDRTDDVPVHPKLRDELEYVRRRDPRWVFPGSRGRDFVTTAAVNRWVKMVGREAGIPNLTPHVLRHTSITQVNDTTGDLRAAQEFARHRDIATTKLYTRVLSKRLTDAVNSIDYFDDDMD